MIYGYARVSTKGQQDNNSFEQQSQEIHTRYENAEMYFESFTGTTTHRPVLEEVLSKLEKNDTLVVTKLDRLARTTLEGIELVQGLFEKGVYVHVLNVGLLENTSMGKFFITTLLAVAELERNQIVERTQTGKIIAKQNPDFKEGRPCVYGKKQKEHALELLKTHTYKEVEAKTGISKSTLIRYKNKCKSSILTE